MNVESETVEMLVKDNQRLKKAGGNLAICAARVIHEYDGLHRLGLALATWHKAVADEGNRAELHT